MQGGCVCGRVCRVGWVRGRMGCRVRRWTPGRQRIRRGTEGVPYGVSADPWSISGTTAPAAEHERRADGVGAESAGGC